MVLEMSHHKSSPIQHPRLYEIVAEKILNEHVLKMKPGQQMSTENEFSKMFSVSVPTVREALRSLVQSGFIRRRQGSGTYRSELTEQKSSQNFERSVAIVTPLDLSQPNLSCYYSQLALLTAKKLQACGLRAEIYFGETTPAHVRSFDETALLRDIKEDKISVAIVMSESEIDSRGYALTLKTAGIPVISADTTQSPSGEDRMMDFLDRSLTILKTNHRRKVACIGFNGHDSSKVRNMVAAKGCVTDDAWMLGDLHPSAAGSGYSLMREVWTTSKIKPDGLIITDDVFFRDVSLAIEELGIKVPDQLFVITAKNRGVQLNADFPLVEIEYDASSLALQLVQNVNSLLNGGQVHPLVCEPQVLDSGFEVSAEADLIGAH
jgi:DNA-binding LacI/PurR family transcriptional regulator